MLKKLTPNLIVDDVNKTIEFYQSTLGCFELVLTDPKKGQFDWALMRCEDVELMFQSKKSLKDKIPAFPETESGGSVIIYIEVDSIEPLYNWIKDRVKVVSELSDTQYRMREFLIEDCNGFIIAFAEWA
ncbi:MAG: bleomycin resistance family protein [Actinobacteria bacterium]|nr:bleomycin resistance family protein [Actinomycetota bacterium]